MTVTVPEHRILKSLLDALPRPQDERGSSVRRFAARLDAAARLSPEELPENVITMHSIFLIRELSSGTGYSFTLVFPWEADPGHNRLSVLSPAGMTLIGRSEGDVAACGQGSHVRCFRVEDIFYQPENAARLRSAGRRCVRSERSAR
jgi:regulator of nucleoside diphosphate kinase